MADERNKPQPPTYIDENGEEVVDYLAMHHTDADTWDLLMDTQVMIDEAVEYIESLPNGAISTTNRVIHIINSYLSDDFDRLLDIHVKICEEIEKHGIVSLDYSSHAMMLEGLPYNLTFEVVRKEQ